jgi:hypothetical protein
VLTTAPPGNGPEENDDEAVDGSLEAWGTCILTELPVEARGLGCTADGGVAILTADGRLRLAWTASNVPEPDWALAGAGSSTGRTLLLVSTASATLTCRGGGDLDGADSSTVLLWHRPPRHPVHINADFLDFSDLRGAASTHRKLPDAQPTWPVVLCTDQTIGVVYPEVAYLYSDTARAVATALSAAPSNAEAVLEWTVVEMPEQVVTAHLHGAHLVTLTAVGQLQLWSVAGAPLPATGESESEVRAAEIASIAVNDVGFAATPTVVPVPEAGALPDGPRRFALVQSGGLRDETVIAWCAVKGGTLDVATTVVTVPWQQPPDRNTVVLSNVHGFDLFYSGCGAGDGIRSSLWAIRQGGCRVCVVYTTYTTRTLNLFTVRANVGSHTQARTHSLRPHRSSRWGAPDPTDPRAIGIDLTRGSACNPPKRCRLANVQGTWQLVATVHRLNHELQTVGPASL